MNKSAVEYNWTVVFEDGSELSGKTLIGWQADDKEIVQGGMSSIGGVGLGTVTPDKAANTLTVKTEGVDGKGEETSSKILLTKKDKDTFTWQALEREGGLVEGPSPVYTFKRVKRQAKKQAE